MKKILLIVLILIFPSFVGMNHSATASSGKTVEWTEVDKISTTIEIDPMSSYYFHVKSSEIKYIAEEKIPVMDALKRVPNWLRDDLEKNLKQLANATVDVGDQAAPALFDFDEDCDLDIIVGTADGYMYIYEQKNNFWVKAGTLNDSAGSPIYAGSNAVPCFEDMNGDGDLDLAVGTWDGRIKWYKNTTQGWVYKGYFVDNNQNEIDVGGYSAPVFGKVYMHPGDPDGLDWDDLTIGAEDGNIYCYENTGNATSPIWTRRDNVYQDVNNCLLAMEHPAAYSKPALVDLDGDGDLDLTVGVDSGKLYYFERGGTAASPSWTYVSGMYANFEACAYAAPHFGDLDRNKLLSQDCVFDLVVGRGDGHLHIYKNLGTVNTPRWDVWPNATETIEHHMDYQDLTRLDKYLNLICDVENEYVDEIAFCIAHTSVDVLIDEDVYIDVFKENAELIYEIDKSIQYANLVEIGNYSTGDYYTTIRYNYSQNGVLKNTTLPRDVYYWFVVHPKITDEIPTFINPETGRPDENGIFWREYLFYHADENYPSNPNTDPNSDGYPDFYYPKDEAPPLLKDKISNVTVMYDNVPYTAPAGYDNDGHNNERPWNYTHAIEVVSNWVEKTLPLNEQESDDGERPIQPVRIMHHHNGNCGELQDLTVAAARTCMIPAAGVSLIGEDHVWSEFYCNNSWHQWDNYWSDSGSVIDDFNLYWRTGDGGWNKRGGSGIFKWWGDDHITDVTGCYVQVASHVEVKVVDADGWAVDGAKVVVSSYWRTENAVEGIVGTTFGVVGYISGAALPSIWGYTNSDGTCEFRLVGTDFNFDIQVTSKLGSDSKSNVEIKEGEDYTGENAFVFELQDAKPRPEPEIEDTPWPTGKDYKIDIEYKVMYGELTGENYVMKEYYGVPNKHPEYVSANIDFFTCTKGNMEKYLKNEAFKCDKKGIDQTSLASYSVNIGEDTYIVFSNDDSVELKKIINITIVLKKEIHEINVHINSPPPGSGVVLISGKAYSILGVETVLVRVDDGNWETANGTENWNYELNTTKYYPGEHIIYARAWDGWDYAVTYTQVVFLNDLPIINILSVYPISNNMVYGVVSINGTVSSINPVQKVEVKIGDTKWGTASVDKEGWNWSYNSLDTMVVNDGEQKIYVKAFNGIMYTVASVSVIVDNTYPLVAITSPLNNAYILGMITVSGTASDINQVKNVSIKIDVSNWSAIDIIPKSVVYWNYVLNTTGLSEGTHTVYVSASDGLHSKTTLITIIVDNNKPPEILYSPITSAVTIKENSTQEFRVINATDPESGNVTIIWYKDGIVQESYRNHTSYAFTADYNSSGIYQIRVEVWDNFWSKEASIQTWSLTVENVNRAPQIVSHIPEQNPLSTSENSSVEFAVLTYDPDNETPSVIWKLDGEQKATGLDYNLYLDYQSSGSHMIEVIVSDSVASVNYVWILNVQDSNRIPVCKNFSPTEKEYTAKAPKHLSLSAELSDPDDDELTVTWYLNGNGVGNESITAGTSTWSYLFTTAGRWNISAKISDGKESVYHSWIVIITAEPEPYIPVTEVGVVLIGILIAVLIALIVKFLFKKK